MVQMGDGRVSQIITLLNKEVEDMTVDELKRELKAQKWLVSTYERLGRIINMHLYNAENKKPEHTAEEYHEQYILGQLDDKEYKLKIKLLKAWDGRDKYNIALKRDRLEYLDILMFAHTAYIRELTDKIEEIKAVEATEKHRLKVRKLPKEYGYNPRKRITKTNYRRDDWGDTRKNVWEHRKRRGK